MKRSMPFAVFFMMAILTFVQAESPRQPIIDVHLHSESLANLKDWGPNPVTGKEAPESVEAIEQTDFLSAEQRRDILYSNAARFLRLTPEQIAEHHKDLKN